MAQAGQRIDGIRDPSALDLPKIQDQIGVSCQRQLEHGDSMDGRSVVPFRLERLFGGGDETNLVQTEPRGGSLRHCHMR